MNTTTRYLNTDLCLASREDLTALADEFDSHGVFPLYLGKEADGLWHAAFETGERRTDPESSISEMLTIVETLLEPFRPLWLECTQREFDIGYDCGAKPWAFNQGLSARLVGRLAAAKASLRLTLYPARDEAGSDTSS